MSYDVRVEFVHPVPRSTLERLLFSFDGFRRNGPLLSYCCDLWREEGVFFSLEGEPGRLGRVRSLEWNLCYGGSRQEVAYLSQTIGDVVDAFGGELADLNVGGLLSLDTAESSIPPRWLEANLGTLASLETGEHQLRSAASLVRKQGKTFLLEAVRTPDRVANLISVCGCYGRISDYGSARRLLERAQEADPRDPRPAARLADLARRRLN